MTISTGTDPTNNRSVDDQNVSNDPTIPNFVYRFLGDNFHPNNDSTTIQLGNKLGLGNGYHALIIGCGNGRSAVTLARSFQCSVTGIDKSENNISLARGWAEKTGFSEQLEFIKSPGDKLNFYDKTFNVVVADCVFHKARDKTGVCSETFRVLMRNGRLGVTDVFVETQLPEQIRHLLSFFGAKSETRFTKQALIELLERVGFHEITVEDHSNNLKKLIAKARTMLPGLGIARKFIDPELEAKLGFSLDELPRLLEIIDSEISSGNITFSMLTAAK
jgi:ubiquinone/menaquinone biosynthesis C-methylase UbiE